MTEENQNKKVSEVYPTHYQQLKQANLIQGEPPTLQDIHKLAQLKADEEHKKAKAKEQDTRRRNIFLCIGYSRAIKQPIHKIIQDLKQTLGLKWLRVSMSYHKFSNLRQIFQQDLQRKLNADVISLDYQNLECNCLGGECEYNNICRETLVVYQAKCKNTGKVYIGSTHQHLKARQQQHNRDAWF